MIVRLGLGLDDLTADLAHLDKEKKTFSAYRFHDEDPIYFSKGLRMTCRNWESLHGGTDEPPAYVEQAAGLELSPDLGFRADASK